MSQAEAGRPAGGPVRERPSSSQVSQSDRSLNSAFLYIGGTQEVPGKNMFS